MVLKINYIYINGVQIAEYETSSYDEFLSTIVKNTANTWQKGRDDIEKGLNTLQGKDAEIAVIKYFDEYVNFTYIPYDCIRIDGGKLHAPFDGLLYKNAQIEQSLLEDTIEHIQKETLANIDN